MGGCCWSHRINCPGWSSLYGLPDQSTSLCCFPSRWSLYPICVMSSHGFCHFLVPICSVPSSFKFLNLRSLKNAGKPLLNARIRNCLQTNWKISTFWSISMCLTDSTCKGMSFSDSLFIPSTVGLNSLSASTSLSPTDQPWSYYPLHSSTPNAGYSKNSKTQVDLCISSDTWDWLLQWFRPYCDRQS